MSNVVFTIHLHISDEVVLDKLLEEMKSVLKKCDVGVDVERHTEQPCVRYSFFDFAKEEIQQLEAEGRYSTSQNLATALRSFGRFRGGEDVLISELLSEIMVAYETWLKKNGICLNTISCYMRSLSAIYNKGVARGMTPQNSPFRHVFTGLEKTVKRAVTATDVQALLNLRLPTYTSLAWARDLFVFSFYARGMPFVDMAYLKKKQIQDGYLVYRRRKTQQEIRVKLERCMLDIIERYGSSDSEYVFPILSPTDDKDVYRQYRAKLSYYNKRLKKLSERLEKGCQLTSYVSRHTWASLAYRSEIKLPIISQALGHSTPSTTLIYVKELGPNVIDEANSKLITTILRNKKSLTSI